MAKGLGFTPRKKQKLDRAKRLASQAAPPAEGPAADQPETAGPAPAPRPTGGRKKAVATRIDPEPAPAAQPTGGRKKAVPMRIDPEPAPQPRRRARPATGRDKHREMRASRAATPSPPPSRARSADALPEERSATPPDPGSPARSPPPPPRTDPRLLQVDAALQREVLEASGVARDPPQRTPPSAACRQILGGIQQARQGFDQSLKDKIKGILAELAEASPIKLHEEQLEMIESLVQQAMITRGAFLASGVGSGKTFMTIAALYVLHKLHIMLEGLPEQAHTVLVVCSEGIAHQWEESIRKLLPADAFEVMRIQCNNLKTVASMQVLEDDCPLRRLRTDPIPPHELVFGVCSSAFFNNPQLAAHLPGCFVLVTDETHEKYRRKDSSSTSGTLLSSHVNFRLQDPGYVISVTSTPVLCREREAKQLISNTGVRVPGHDLRRLSPTDHIHVLKACSVKSTQQLRDKIPNSFSFVLRVPSADGTLGLQAQRHGNGCDLATIPRFKVALNLIMALWHRGSVCFFADNTEGLRQMKELVEGQLPTTEGFVHVLTGDSTDQEKAALWEAIKRGDKIVLLMTPAMGVGYDFSFLCFIILACTGYSEWLTAQNLGRMVRFGQKQRTASFVLYTEEDAHLYETIQERTRLFEAYYEQSPINSVPGMKDLVPVRIKDVAALAASVCAALPRLDTAADAKRLCLESGAMVLWERQSHIRAAPACA